MEEYEKTKILPNLHIDFYDEKYQKFYTTFLDIKEKNTTLSKKVYELFYKIVDFVDETKLNKFNFFIKQLRDFENVLGEKIGFSNDVIGDSAKEVVNKLNAGEFRICILENIRFEPEEEQNDTDFAKKLASYADARSK